MLRKPALAALLITLICMLPITAFAAGSATGTLNPTNMDHPEMKITPAATPVVTPNTYTGTESINGTDRYDMSGIGGMNTIHTNNYRAQATTSATNRNWSWLGLFGLLGLAGLFGRSRSDNRDPI